MAVGWTESAGEHGRVAPAMLARAAEYVRMSTEHQKYSTENQAEAMQQYAARRGIEIVRTYADAGKSGLSLDGRDGLKQLIEDVQNKTADFTTILVYDISRWGRFQDADKSLTLDEIAKSEGIVPSYVTRLFRLTLLAPNIVSAILAGKHPPELNARKLLDDTRLPLDWNEQRRSHEFA